MDMDSGGSVLKQRCDFLEPARRKALGQQGALYQCKVDFLQVSEAKQPAHSHTLRVAVEEFNHVTRAEFAFLNNAQVITAATAEEELLDELRTTEFVSQLEARH